MGKVETKKKVAVALSGGVDSSVAALLLKKAGYAVVGVHLVCYDEDAPYCTARQDREDAVRIAANLNIPLKVYDFKKPYQQEVIDYFLEEYKKNRTPNPDIMCNKKIKFGLLFEKITEELRAEYLATGHYARRSSDFRLLTGVDRSKDQSYFLYTLTREKLKKVLFPVGSLYKKEVRKIAKRAGLPTADKKDSQGICFMGKVPLSDFLKRVVESRRGKVVNTKGEVIGEHKGLPFSTIGQRHGFTINRYLGKPLYVTDKETKTNTLVVGPKSSLRVKEFEVSNVHWIDRSRVTKKCRVRIRHLGRFLKCEVGSGKWDLGSRKLEVRLKEPAYGVAPGQSAVFYRGAEVLGGGVIL